MRICGGLYGGRKIKAGEGDAIRPTTDKVRQAIFNMLASRMDISESYVLDLFCGSGSLGLEALSRGAKHAIFVDISAKSLKVARENIVALEIEGQATLLKSDATRPTGVALPASIPHIDLVVMDPPFFQGFAHKTLTNLASAKWLSPESLIVLESEKIEDIPQDYTLLAQKDYGRSKIHLLSIG